MIKCFYGQGESEMTKQEAQKAIENSTKVEAGEGDDHDVGVILSVDGNMAIVGWQSGVSTPCPIDDLKTANESGGWR